MAILFAANANFGLILGADTLSLPIGRLATTDSAQDVGILKVCCLPRSRTGVTVARSVRDAIRGHTMKCTIIGLGAMGLPMAKRLLQAGVAVTGFDVTDRRCAALVDAGGRATDSVVAAADGADIVIVMVINAVQAHAVVASLAGALATEALVVLGATVSPHDARALAKLVPGHLFLDAPVSGGVAGAESGRLAIMASGSDEALAKATPVLHHLGRIYRVGSEVGQGSLVKAVNQLLCGVHIIAAAEAFAFARSAGVDPNILMEVIGAGAAQSSMFTTRAPRMRDNDFTAKSAIQLFTKDLAIVLDATRDAGVPAFLTATALQVFQAAVVRGLAEADDSAVVQVYEQIA
ncbi:NAD(P)-dependent oxidoreductase [Bradyrhizobium sp. LA7.1]|uniref:NAD(P)-dependent oxidoreductase n=1 Tax=Bradyrhizobium sp. LA7.1 TaxID=3156324 RepID=UPI0033922E85